MKFLVGDIVEDLYGTYGFISEGKVLGQGLKGDGFVLIEAERDKDGMLCIYEVDEELVERVHTCHGEGKG